MAASTWARAGRRNFPCCVLAAVPRAQAIQGVIDSGCTRAASVVAHLGRAGIDGSELPRADWVRLPCRSRDWAPVVAGARRAGLVYGICHQLQLRGALGG